MFIIVELFYGKVEQANQRRQEESQVIRKESALFIKCELRRYQFSRQYKYETNVPCETDVITEGQGSQQELMASCPRRIFGIRQSQPSKKKQKANQIYGKLKEAQS